MTVSSLEHRPGKLAFDDLQSEHAYSPRGAYQQSKFANAVFGLELDRRLRAAGLAGDQRPRPPRLLGHEPADHRADRRDEGAPCGSATRSSPRAPTRARCRSSTRRRPPDVERRRVLRARRLPADARGSPKRVRPVDRAEDEETAQRLWAVSEELTGVSYLRPECGDVFARSGEVGLPAPVAELAARDVGRDRRRRRAQRAHRRRVSRQGRQAGAGAASAASSSAARRPWSARLPTSASSSAPAPTSSACSTRW